MVGVVVTGVSEEGRREGGREGGGKQGACTPLKEGKRPDTHRCKMQDCCLTSSHDFIYLMRLGVACCHLVNT